MRACRTEPGYANLAVVVSCACFVHEARPLLAVACDAAYYDWSEAKLDKLANEEYELSLDGSFGQKLFDLVKHVKSKEAPITDEEVMTIIELRLLACPDESEADKLVTSPEFEAEIDESNQQEGLDNA